MLEHNLEFKYTFKLHYLDLEFRFHLLYFY